MSAFIDREDEILAIILDGGWERSVSIEDCTYAIALVLSGSGVLLVRDRRNHRWELPGGFVEEGESLQACIERETEEEAGISPFPFVPIGALVVKPPQERKRLPKEVGVIFRASWSMELTDFSGEETSQAKIFPLDGLPDDIARIDGEVVRTFCRRVVDAGS